jgi:hypothetical protein
VERIVLWLAIPQLYHAAGDYSSVFRGFWYKMTVKTWVLCDTTQGGRGEQDNSVGSICSGGYPGVWVFVAELRQEALATALVTYSIFVELQKPRLPDTPLNRYAVLTWVIEYERQP